MAERTSGKRYCFMVSLILFAVSKETFEILRNADEIIVSEIKQAGLYYKLC